MKKFSPTLEKCIGDSLKQLDVVQKISAAQKTLRPSFGSTLVTGLLEFTARVYKTFMLDSKTPKTPNNLCNAMDLNSVIKFFVNTKSPRNT